MNRYVVVDALGVAVNTILWDGVTLYEPGEGYSLVLESEYVPPEAPGNPEE